MAASDKTIDIPFQDLAENYDLQSKLKLASCVFIKPDVGYARFDKPLTEEELHKSVAGFLSAFARDPADQKQRREYLLNNGLVRILLIDDALREEFKKIISAQASL
jgi:hypothetical protein